MPEEEKLDKVEDAKQTEVEPDDSLDEFNWLEKFLQQVLFLKKRLYIYIEVERCF